MKKNQHALEVSPKHTLLSTEEDVTLTLYMCH